MFGYFIAAGFGLILILLGFIVLARAGPRTGRRTPGRKPVQADQPSADAPTPGRSVTATPAEADAARRVTPPA